ncbi:MAG: type II secretion system F family protein, partial [Actinobacteria bacterium]|nr:type II secretion system F family protein [Actinomycetota bacterium]
MPQTEYIVKARSRTGRLVEEKLTAVSEADALSRVRNLGMTPIAVETVSKTGMNRNVQLLKPRVKPKDLAVFSRQFATMLASGLPILRCLTILSEQSPNPTLRGILGEVTTDVERGDSLSIAMQKQKPFPPLMISMIRAGEVGGFLDTTMLEIAASMEADVLLRSKIKSAMTYPVAVGIIAVLITIAMLIFVVPIFSEMFASFGGQLPAPTQLLVNLSHLITNPLVSLPILGGIVALAMVYRRKRTSLKVRAVVDPIKFRVPIFGKLFQKIALARFTRNLSTLLAAGVPVLTALDIVADTSGNIVIARAVHADKESVRDGAGMAAPLAKHAVFPEMVVQMIAVGEDTGAVDTMLRKIAEFYDQEVEATTEQLMALI